MKINVGYIPQRPPCLQAFPSLAIHWRGNEANPLVGTTSCVNMTTSLYGQILDGVPENASLYSTHHCFYNNATLYHCFTKQSGMHRCQLLARQWQVGMVEQKQTGHQAMEETQ